MGASAAPIAFLYLPKFTAAPIPAAGTSSAAAIYTDGTSLLASINAAAYVALVTPTTGTFTSPVTITPTGAGPLTGLAVTMTSATGLTTAIQGLVITTAATTAAKAASQAAGLMILGQHSAMRSLGVQVRNTSALWLAAGSAGGRGSIFSIGWDTTNFSGAVAASILTGQTVLSTLDGITNVDASTNNVSFCGQFIGAPVTTDATATTATAAGIVNVLGTVGLVVFSRMTAAPVLDVVAQNTSGTIVQVRYPAGITTTLAGGVSGLLIDLSTNVTSGANACTGLSIVIPATTRASTAGEGAIYVNSAAITARSLDVAIGNTSGSPIQFRWGTSATQVGGTKLITLDLQTNVTPGTQLMAAITILPANNTQSNGIAFGAGGGAQAHIAGPSDQALAFTSTNANPINFNLNNTIQITSVGGNVNYGWTWATGLGAVTHHTGPTDQPFLLRGGSTQTLALGTNATTYLAIANTGLATHTMTATTGTGYTLSSTATLTGAATGLLVNLSGVTPGANACTGIFIRIPATTAAGASNQGAIAIASLATTARILDMQVNNTSGILIQLSYTPAQTLSGSLTALNINLLSTTPGANPVTGITISIPATTSADAGGQGALFIHSLATLNRVIDINASNTGAASGIVVLRYGTSSTTFTAAVTGYLIDLNTNIASAANQVVTGISCLLGGGNTALTDPAAGSAVAIFDYRSVNGTTAGILAIQVGVARTLSGSLLGQLIDLSTNVTPGANACTGLKIALPATTVADASGQGALVISSTATQSRIVDIAVANVGAGGGIMTLRYGTATTLTATTIGVLIDLNTGVIPAAQVLTGLNVKVAPTVAAGAAGQGAIAVLSNATAARVLDLGVNNATGTIVNVAYPASQTLTGAVTGLNLDLSTNVTPGANALTGLLVTIPASTVGTTVGISVASTQQGVTSNLLKLSWTASAFGASASDTITLANISVAPTGAVNGSSVGLNVLVGANVTSAATSAAATFDWRPAGGTLVGGGIVQVKIGGATTLTGAIVGQLIDLSTNVQGAQANIGLKITMVAADRGIAAPLQMNGVNFFINAGIPLNVNGSNGDFYFDSAGSHSGFRPAIYQRQAGAWVGVAS